MEKIKKVIDDLISRNIIVDKVSEGKESFSVMVLSPEREEITENKNSDAEHESLEEDENCKSLEQFINDKFYETLVNKIKDEVKIANNTETSLLKEKLETNNVQIINPEYKNDTMENALIIL